MSDTTYAGTGFMPPLVMTPDDSQDLTVDMFDYAVFDSEINETTTVENAGVFVLTQDNLIVTNNVIDTDSFIGSGQLLQSHISRTYNYRKHNVYDGIFQSDAAAEFMDKVISSKGIGFSQIQNKNNITNISVRNSEYTSQDVKIFEHVQEVGEPTFYANDQNNDLVNYYTLPFGYSDNEKIALKNKFGFDYDSVLETPDVPSYTQNKISSMMSSISEDLRTGALSRVDVVKTTKQLQLDSVAFEEIPTDEVFESTQTVAAATTVAAPTTNTTSDSGTSGGGY